MKHTFIGCMVLVFVFGIMINCNKDTTTTPSGTDITGTWTAMALVSQLGAMEPDSFFIALTLTNPNKLKTGYRHMVFSSSGDALLDSFKNEGTWTQNGNSVTLSPASCTQLLTNGWTSVNCWPSITVPVNIVNGHWTVKIPSYVNPADDTLTYDLVKQ